MRTTRNILPKLRKISYKNKKHRYKLKNNTRKRRMAINEGVHYEAKTTSKTMKQAAIAKKGRFNILRIYRRYKQPKQCLKITKDMRYLDKKYKLGKTKNICGEKKKETNVNKKGTKSKSGGYKKRRKTTKKTDNKRKTHKKKQKKQFLYNPNDPEKSFDVYIDKNPKDTIHIKYTTIGDIKDTIKKLERLFKTKKYSHKRIWQVGMIMKVRLEAMKKHQKTKYPNAKNLNKRFNLANKYFKFLSKRTKEPTFKERKQMTFKF